ncbi:glycosyltransferase family 2 protein [Flavobacterium anhuiense]|uniref:glycosyltransferase family 2 protein n=1 Tax=Flavobacterium anhuiense TaxID=459526 RepID=UPI0034D97870
MSDLPLISVCIPTYNGEKYLQETLESIQLQTYSNVELIISDDSSIDKTLDIIKKFKVISKYPVFLYHHNPTGIGSNWNNCIKKANGELIKFLFQDDVMEYNCLERMVSVYNKNPQAGLIASKRSFIVEKNVIGEITNNWIEKYRDLQIGLQHQKADILILDKAVFKRSDFRKSPLNKIGEPSVVLFRKDIVNQIGYFRADLKQILDYEYWYRILKRNTIVIINEQLVRFRIHEDQATNVNREKAINDYSLYDKILYKEYFNLLSEENKLRLRHKFSLIMRINRKLLTLFSLNQK